MKRSLRFITIILIVFILFGCSIKNDNNITISKDGKVDFDVLIAFDKDLLSALIKAEVIKETDNISEYVSDNVKDDYLYGFDKESYVDTEYVGNSYSYSVEDINEISALGVNTVNLNNQEIVNKKIFKKEGKVYSADFVYNLENKDNYSNVDFINTFRVNLPSRALSSNADMTMNNGKTLVWNIVNGEEKSIKFSFAFSNNRAYISIASIAFDIAVVIAIYVIEKKRGAQNEE